MFIFTYTGFIQLRVTYSMNMNYIAEVQSKVMQYNS